MAISMACSRVIFGLRTRAGRISSVIDGRGVWAGVDIAEAVLFLLDLKKGMVGERCDREGG